MRLPLGRRAFAAMALSKFHFSHLPPQTARLISGPPFFFGFYWQNVIDPPHPPMPRDILVQTTSCSN